MRGILAAGAAALVVSLFTQSSAQTTVSVNREVRYQTIEGFGTSGMGFGAWKEPSGPFLVDVNLDSVGFYDTLISELGATAFRIYCDGRLEGSQGVIDHPEELSSTYRNVRKLATAAERQDEPLRFITTSWSPPAWMKVIGAVPCGHAAAPNCRTDECRLKPDMEAHLADYFVRYIRLLKDSAGIDAYALSIQNEPAFREPYASCVFCPGGYRALLKAVGARFRAEGMSTRFYGAEHVSHSFNTFERAVRVDAEALSYMHAWAVHGYYSDGITADTGVYGGSTPTDKPLWMSETSGYGATFHDWPKALVLANTMLSYLRDAKITLWTWWTLMHNTNESIDVYDGAGGCLLVNGKGTDKYHVSRHYYRYIRPGSRQIQCTSSNTNVKVVAFYHERNDCMTIVLLNTGGATTIPGITGANVPSTFEMVVSTAEAKLQRSMVASNENIDLPGSSLTTLVAGTYRSTGSVATIEQSVPTTSRGVTSANAVRMVIHTLDGRRVNAFDTSTAGTARTLPAGICVRTFVDANGRVISATRLTVEGR